MNEDYGRIIPVEGGAEPIDPSLRYRVVFAVTKPIGDGGAPHHDLVRVARFLTLLADAGVSIEADDVLAIVSGPATSIVTLGDAVNRPLIEHALSHEWTPASSICWSTPATTTSVPSAIARTPPPNPPRRKFTHRNSA